MSLEPGTRLGPYDIISVIGAGGMGEVYRAHDAKLNRDVAIKVLPDALAADADRLARFTREAQTLAALNHPNIAQVYGFEGGAVAALVMELVEGDDLSALIARGPMTPPDALPIARQIADALEAAHEQGIIHRDLKPANIKVRTDGTVKVLDFGLAKALGSPGSEDSGQSAGAANSPTLTARATQMGMILGTAAYMAPEQAKGKAVDRRADIWAFGVVLYEMLTGRRAFDGEDVSTTLAAVLMRDPEWTALPADTPPVLRMLIQRCLERDPKIRLRDIGEARVLLSNPTTASAAPPQTSAITAPARAGRLFWVVAFAGVLVAAALGAWAAWRLQPRPAEPLTVRLAVTTQSFAAVSAISFAVSPDGRMLAFVAPHPTTIGSVLWVRPLGELQARILPGTEGAQSPFWSPDSRHLGFGANGKLKTIDVTGGPPQPVCDLSVGFLGAAWNNEGTILFATGPSTVTVSLSRVSDRGGPIAEVLQPDRSQQQTSLLWPAFLPDGRHFLYLAWSNEPDKRAIFATSLDGGPPKLVVKASASAAFVAPGTLLYLRDTALMAQPFDTGRMQLTGEAVRLADGVLYSRTSGRAAVAASSTVLAFREGVIADPISNLAWVNRAGQPLGTVGDRGPYNQVRLSPDGKRVSVSVPDLRTSGFNMWVLDLGNKIMSQATFEETANDPIWSPDGQALAFESLQKAKRDFYQQVVGSRTTTLLFESPDDPKWLDDWSRDGQFLLFHTPRPSKLVAIPLTGDRKAQLLAESPAAFDGAHFSPDAKWVAYGTNESGEYEVWVAAFPAFDKRRQVSAHGGGQAMWRGDGKELYFLTPDGKMMAAPITSSGAGAIEFGAPVELFQSPIQRPIPTIDQYAVTRDGDRFLFIQPVSNQEAPVVPITVVVNWATGINKK